MFDDSDLVSVQVQCRIGNELKDSTLLFCFSHFNDLLRFSGSSGDRLQMQVCDQLLGSGEQPYTVFPEAQYAVFTTCELKLSYLIEGDDSCLHVDELRPLSLIQQAKNVRAIYNDFKEVHIENRQSMNHSLREIASMYRYYAGLLELNLKESAAREKSGLQNDRLFRLAFQASRSFR